MPANAPHAEARPAQAEHAGAEHAHAARTGVQPAADAAPDAAKRPGRPRSERAEHAIIDAALDAFAEFGVEGVRCEDVATRAGVGKATLYRRYPGKEDLLIAALAALKSPLPEPRGQSVRDDLIAMVDVMACDSDDPRFARQFAMLHGEGERYPRLLRRYKETVVEPRREMIRSVIRRGIASGELRPGTDVEVAMLALTGAVMARGKHEPPQAFAGCADSATFAVRVIDQLLHGIGS
ncbi:MAG TPA: TetR/AcrR family transcriptional regulator C-terminal ligand-binding domain-containing protein [Trebonia sp.]|jgi:AcrR family transcriptional regulator|nr:TetR/AcrR family transcriptional regulator C-terminal ligand-binding domain-containing protein [Trebonia sp.]